MSDNCKSEHRVFSVCHLGNLGELKCKNLLQLLLLRGSQSKVVGNFEVWHRQPIPRMGLQELRRSAMTSEQQQNLTIYDRGLVLEETPYPNKLDLTPAFIFARAIFLHTNPLQQGGREVFFLESKGKEVHPQEELGLSNLYVGGPFNSLCGHFYVLFFRNTLSTAGNSMTSSEMPSSQPLLKKKGAPSRTEGERILEMQLGVLSRTLEGNFWKNSESVSGIFPENFQNFLRKVPAVTGDVAYFSSPTLPANPWAPEFIKK